jgi:YfiH family protein
MRPEIFFKEDQGVLALTSDGSIDFIPADFDSPLTVAQRAYLRSACGADISQVFWRKQIHGDDILVASGGAGASKGCPDADAYITDEKNLPIAIRTADCVPVFIFDPRHRVIGLAHAGWRGTYKAIAAKTVQRMREKFDSQPSDLKIVLGPSIRECCYQVGEEFRHYFLSHVKDRGGYLYADVTGVNRDQLLQAGVRQENIFDSGICTCCNKNYFSFRRDGAKAGRMISLMMLI